MVSVAGLVWSGVSERPLLAVEGGLWVYLADDQIRPDYLRQMQRRQSDPVRREASAGI